MGEYPQIYQRILPMLAAILFIDPLTKRIYKRHVNKILNGSYIIDAVGSMAINIMNVSTF